VADRSFPTGDASLPIARIKDAFDLALSKDKSVLGIVLDWNEADEILIIPCRRYDRGCSQLKRHMNRLLVVAFLCAPVASAAIRILPSPQYAEELTTRSA